MAIIRRLRRSKQLIPLPASGKDTNMVTSRHTHRGACWLTVEVLGSLPTKCSTHTNAFLTWPVPAVIAAPAPARVCTAAAMPSSLAACKKDHSVLFNVLKQERVQAQVKQNAHPLHGKSALLALSAACMLCRRFRSMVRLQYPWAAARLHTRLLQCPGCVQRGSAARVWPNPLAGS